MSRGLLYALFAPLFAAEVWAQFAAHDQQLTTVFAVLGLGVLVVAYLLRPQAADQDCPPDCPKCRESEGVDL